MQTREIGKSGIQASVIGLGTWVMGGWRWGGSDEKKSIAAIHAAIEAGVSLIDTAPVYGFGVAEELVGRAIKKCRDKVVLATKCGLVWHQKKGTFFFNAEGHDVHRYLGKDAIAYDIEQSLRRLQTDYIDHYITHWQDSTTPIDETMEALLKLKEEGKIRSIGISNSSTDDLITYQASGHVDAVQEKYNMLDRDLESSLLPLCQSGNVSVLSYASLATGLLTGKLDPDRIFTGDDQRIGNPRFTAENRKKILLFFEKLAPVAAKYELSKAQLVIAWTIAQPGITFALCGARTPEQAIENAKAGQVVLENEDIVTINNTLLEI